MNISKDHLARDYVFPGNGTVGHIIEPRKQMAHVTEATGILFTVHDLRRTFITIAESLDIPAYALKCLLNHKMTNDVTAGYIIVDVERLRKPIQLASRLGRFDPTKPNITLVSIPSISYKDFLIKKEVQP